MSLAGHATYIEAATVDEGHRNLVPVLLAVALGELLPVHFGPAHPELAGHVLHDPPGVLTQKTPRFAEHHHSGAFHPFRCFGHVFPLRFPDCGPSSSREGWQDLDHGASCDHDVAVCPATVR